VLGPNLIGFADFKGNRQLVSTGHLDANDRVALFMMDYPHRTRLKLLGHARVLDAREHPELVDQLAPEAVRSKAERLFLIQVSLPLLQSGLALVLSCNPVPERT
jgi:uncharacterized protein